MKTIFLSLIAFYQYFISPWVGYDCRFHPTCSNYAKEAILKHGAWFGIWLGVIRILKCQPFCRGGEDQVPPISSKIKK